MSIPGLITRAAAGRYAEVLARLENAFVARGVVPIARIDHASAAAQVGLPLAPLMLFVFGNPHAGTGLMQARPTLGIDLPLKLIVWEDADGVHVGYNDPAWLIQRHDGDNGAPILNTMRDLLEALAREAAS
ncbi:DUF302 domain-containing protein [Sphingomonas sp. NBWT7]|uniref:DUF302 domain-containing protein n=1 Tax=Sphingomonas sp. NBWT7 TaxID=2596913 RepID=UPI0016237F30|nr:DUF302 domain-containing protein [Sphingomonas sp. NBWT7]QNE31065.1 DUF302 domain-containing protein [Sphingomonas sp. NBWT7]